MENRPPKAEGKARSLVRAPFRPGASLGRRCSGAIASTGLDSTRFDSALGTIGGGNHFAELQAIEKVYDTGAFEALELEKDNLCLLVHSGSRGLGESVLREYVEEHGASGVSAESAAAQAYLAGHDQAVHWAEENRALIAERFLECLGAIAKECRMDATTASLPLRQRTVLYGCTAREQLQQIEGRCSFRVHAAP